VITVRAARAGEGASLRELRLRALSEAPGMFGSTAVQEGDHPEALWSGLAEGVGVDGEETAVYVAIDDEHWVGMAAGRWFDRDRRIAQLWGMWVQPELRGRGTGERLALAVRGWAQSHEARFLRLGVIEDSPAIALYERLGFVDTGERKPLRRDPNVTALYMVRPA
jgi:ribosomal protein S18 acetylase RimI-like enzyme